MGEVRESLSESRTALAGVFRNPNLRRVNLAFAGSVIGDWAYAVGASVYAYTRGGATAIGILAVARYVSMAILAPFAAMLADRWDRKRVMIGADLIRLVLVLVAAVVIEVDGPSMVVYVLAVLTGIAGTAFRPAQASLMPSLANTPGELTAANVAASTIESVGFFVGPAIGGLILAFGDVGTVYVFNAATFVWSALLVARIRSVRGDETLAPTEDGGDEGGDEVGAGFFDGVGAGFREIHANRDLRLLIGLYVAQTIVAGASAVFGVAIALDLLDLGESGVGLLDSTLGVGGLVGGLVALVIAPRGRLARDFGLGVALWASPLLLIAAWPTLTSAIVAMVLIGLANSVVDVNAFTILQRLTPDEVMGRVFGAMESAVVAGMAIGALIMPVMINTIGLRAGLTVIGVGVSAVVVVCLAGLLRIDTVALAPPGLELLRRVPILGVLPGNVLERLARGSTRRDAPAGTVMIREGDPGDVFYIIESGTAAVTIGGAQVKALAAGDSFGELALLRAAPRAATVTATSDVVLRVLAREPFLRAVAGDSESARRSEMVVTSLLGIR